MAQHRPAWIGVDGAFRDDVFDLLGLDARESQRDDLARRASGCHGSLHKKKFYVGLFALSAAQSKRWLQQVLRLRRCRGSAQDGC